MPHTIRRQVLDVEVRGSEADGLLLQRTLPALCRQWLLPAIEQALEHCERKGDVLTIDRLEIDAGTLSMDRFVQDLPATVRLVLESDLKEKIALLDAVAAAPGAGANAPGLQRKTLKTLQDEALAFFLETGSLPSSSTLPPGQTFEGALLETWRTAEDPGTSAGALDSMLVRALQSRDGRNRLVLQFSPRLLQALLMRLSPQAAATLELVLAVKTGGSARDRRAFERAAWHAAFAHAAAGSPAAAVRLVREALQALRGHVANHAGLARVLQRRWPGAIKLAAPGSGRPGAAPAGGQQQDAAGPVARHSDHSDHRDHPDAEEGIFIDNAGLVLLHPFLPRLFKGLGWAVGDALTEPERALHMLHYLASGEAPAPEYLLPLPKILCNLPLTRPVDAAPALRRADEEEAIAMLKAVVDHWSALRNTSVDSLRATFLQRAGKMRRHEDGWRLQVEAQTVDILLNQLPWGISMVRLPWMASMLTVEWI
jgi:hypothetical protein